MYIKQFKPKKQTAKQILEQFSKTSFQARRLGEVYDICRKMVSDKKCETVLTLSGAIVPVLKDCIIECIENNWVQAIVSTGANLTHDLANVFGEEYIHWKGESDIKLRKKKTSRIYDIVSPDKSSIVFEKNIQRILENIRGELTPSEILRKIGKKVKNKSVVSIAARKNIPIYCPALSDSILGFQIWMYSQDHDLKINEFGDLGKIFDYMYNLKTKKIRTGVIILGGGVPKNFAIQAALLPGKPYDYAVQITTDIPQFGGLSGASLEEAVSWGKIKEKAKISSVFCDATIAFPLIISALKEEL